jgi:polyhydroxyalkanoate synthesis repressor PhaR
MTEGSTTTTTGHGEKRLDIRKYPNRRYYDSTRSRHVTLEEIYALIRDGYEVQVTDSKTGEDITAKVLAQIIIDLDTSKLGVFPAPLLHRLLRSNEQIVQDFVDKYFNQALSAFLDSQRGFEQYLRQAMGLQSAVPTVADLTKMMWGPLSPGLWGQRSSPVAPHPAPAPTPAPQAAPAAQPAVAPHPPATAAAASKDDDLRDVVDQLKQEVARLRAAAPRNGAVHLERSKSRSKTRQSTHHR